MLKILCITDDKPGHRSQMDGLLKSLSESTTVESQWLSIHSPEPLPAHYRAHLILAAGHRTHWSALKCRFKHGGKLVVIMKPSLPLWLFDLCIAPIHDGLKKNPRVFNTEGAMNPVPPSSASDPRQGLILIGGPAKYYQWNNVDLLAQLQQLCSALPEIDWVLTTSRRTPESFSQFIFDLKQLGITVVPQDETDHAWLLDQYQHAGSIWTTEDSVSMVYESLSSGAQVGVLQVPLIRENRISRNLQQLIANGRVLKLDTLLEQGNLPPRPFPPLQEAKRAADYILFTLLKIRSLKS